MSERREGVGPEGKNGKETNKSRCQKGTEYASGCNVRKNISLIVTFMPKMTGRESKQRRRRRESWAKS